MYSAVLIANGNIQVIEKEASVIQSSQSSSSKENIVDLPQKKKHKIQNEPLPNIHHFMQQYVTINITQQVVSMIALTTNLIVPIVSSPPQSITPQFLSQEHPNDFPSLDTPCNPPTSIVSKSHESDVLPIITEEEKSHQVIVPHKEPPNHNS
ncbi:hypothetical protein O181_034445 [Austropuccinia psidii MF-1]|uniref:Uncharacterized protein n=1 Tax=Austropuccinia psidii MF-1 TaxID=1389203 RepID=A0A9Q3D317_9BASI|nr:hypothetical protein [Austropuccinia psidii MF-1]